MKGPGYTYRRQQARAEALLRKGTDLSKTTLIVRHVNGMVLDRYEVLHVEADGVLGKFPYNSELERGTALHHAESARRRFRETLTAEKARS